MKVKRYIQAIGLIGCSLMLNACLTTQSRHEFTLNKARRLAQQDRYTEALNVLDKYSEKCADPALAKQVKPLKMAYKTRWMEVAASDYDRTVELARELAREGEFRKAVRLIEKAEKQLTDKDQIKHLKMMKIAYSVEL